MVHSFVDFSQILPNHGIISNLSESDFQQGLHVEVQRGAKFWEKNEFLCNEVVKI